MKKMDKKSLLLYKTKCYKFCHAGRVVHKPLLFSCSFPSKPSFHAGFLFFNSLKTKQPMPEIPLNPLMSTPATTQDLTEAMTQLQSSMVNLVEKQTVLMEKLDGFVIKVMAHEERLKRLEDSLLTHLECATWVKATIRFWPVMIAGFLLLLGHEVH